MQQISDRELYRDEFNRFMYDYEEEDRDYFLWPEDFASYTIFPMKGKFQEILTRYDLEEDTAECLILYINPYHKNIITTYRGYVSDSAMNLYLPEKTFENHWRDLYYGIRKGMLLHPEKYPVAKYEDFFDFSCYDPEPGTHWKVTAKALLQVPNQEHEDLLLVQKEVFQPQNKVPNAFYYYSKRGSVYHDRSCKAVLSMNPKNLCTSSKIPQGLAPCPHCLHQLILTTACSPNKKEIPHCAYFLRKYHVPDELLERLVIEHGMHFHMNGDRELMVECREDKWLIDDRSTGLVLWHNSYYKNGESRIMRSGQYHEQRTGKSLCKLLQYIDEYRYDAHTHCKIQTEEPVSIEQSIERNQSGVGILEWLKGLFTKATNWWMQIKS